ncbi:MAG: ATP-binding protein [Oscillospiraceae bacterium]
MLNDLAVRLSALSVFRNVLKDDVVSKMVKMFEEPSPCTCGEFCSALYAHTDNLTEYLMSVISEDENDYMLRHAQMKEIPQVMDTAAHEELKILGEAGAVTPMEVRACMSYDGYMAGWNTSSMNFRDIYARRMSELQTKGYGIFAKYYTFLLRDGVIVPVKNPDPQRLSQLSGYENERKKVIDNTKALLRGQPAANALLYGDAGTGKSSTVKAVVNEFKDDGLRLIEMKKSQLHEMPLVIEKIAKNPLKFIIFIDDLSFSSDDDDFGALKAVLEGSASSKTSNIVIYATSNRRHLVKEKYSDRGGDDMHARDSMEELTSLSERFGLKVTFTKPNKDLYLRIVESLADSYGLECDREELFSKAEAYALRRSGRSGRAARQFVEMMLSGQL